MTASRRYTDTSTLTSRPPGDWLGLRGPMRLGFQRESLDTPFQLSDEVRQVRIQQFAHIAQLERIDPTYTTLDVAQERLAAAHLLRQRDLRHATPRPQLTDELTQGLVLGTVNGLGHDRNW